MANLKVELGAGQDYEVQVERGAVKRLVLELAKLSNEKSMRFALVTDSNVDAAQAGKLEEMLVAAEVEFVKFVVPAGEATKNWNQVGELVEAMLAAGFSRSDAVVAFGGGVVGDLAGFVAAVFMRGIKVFQVPTTLLAMTDAAIGGKTGVNAQAGKNLMGAFHQPERVYVDVDLLSSLSREEMISGYAEVVKHAVIADEVLFEILERADVEDFFSDLNLVSLILERSCAVKVGIVSRDVKEAGERMKLNLGHTLGHAVEKAMKFQLAHGKAVAIGMVAACELAVAENLMTEEADGRIKSLINKIGLPTDIPKDLEKEELIELMSSDKKVKQKKINLILPTKIGEVIISRDFEAADLLRNF